MLKISLLKLLLFWSGFAAGAAGGAAGFKKGIICKFF
jgi:hypothetical protein